MLDEVGRMFLYILLLLIVVLGISAVVVTRPGAVAVIIIGYFAFILIFEVLAHFLGDDEL